MQYFLVLDWTLEKKQTSFSRKNVFLQNLFSDENTQKGRRKESISIKRGNKTCWQLETFISALGEASMKN